MAYLNLDIHYFTNIKTKRLVGLLGKGAELLPLRLWCHCAEHHAENGELAGYTAQELEEMSRNVELRLNDFGIEAPPPASAALTAALPQPGTAVRDWRSR